MKIFVVENATAEELDHIRQETAKIDPDIQVINEERREGIVIRDELFKRDFEGPIFKYKKYDDGEARKPLLLERRVHPKKRHPLRSVSRSKR
jgi:hypothetical protein